MLSSFFYLKLGNFWYPKQVLLLMKHNTYSSISLRQLYSLSFLRNTAPSKPFMADNVLVLNLDVSINISLKKMIQEDAVIKKIYVILKGLWLIIHVIWFLHGCKFAFTINSRKNLGTCKMKTRLVLQCSTVWTSKFVRCKPTGVNPPV